MAVFRSMGARPDATRGTTAQEVRRNLTAFFDGPGILDGSVDPLVVGTTGQFAYTVRNGLWVTTRGASADGYHLWGNEGALVVSTSDTGATLVAPASGLSRYDVIYALHPSAGENGDTTSEPVVAVSKGTAASSPPVPAIPTGALELARNLMTSAATSTTSSGNTFTRPSHIRMRGIPSPSWPLRTLQTMSGLSVANNTWTPIDFGVGTLPGDDGGAGDSPSVSSGTWTFARTGVYDVFFAATFAGNATGVREARLLLNGSTQLDYDRQYSANPQARLQCRGTYRFAAGDTLVFQVRQTSGAALSLVNAAGQEGANRANLTFLRPA